MPSREAELAWAAGLFEGEGWIGPKGARAGMSLSMTDEDVVERFAAVVECGTVSGPWVRTGHPERKPMFSWQASGRADVARLLDLFLPWMGVRRKARMETVRLRLTPPPDRCPNGHPKTPETTYLHQDGRPRCVLCLRARKAAYDARRYRRRKELADGE
jgi:hypothetical protein